MPTLGELCLRWCREQYAVEPVPSRETLAAWFELANRGLDKMVLAGTRLNHCAMAQSAALAFGATEQQALNLKFPHGMRAGAKQLMSDAIERHRWHAVSEARAGVWTPHPGDLAIYDRSQPGRPETSWWGHVDRIIEAGEREYSSIGANEGPGGAWKIDIGVPYAWSTLLGFVAYPQGEAEPPVHLLSPEDVARIKGMVALTLDQTESRHWETAGKATV